MTIDLWIGLFLANMLVGLAPGQNVTLVTETILRNGLRGGCEVLAGILLAEVIWTLLALGVLLGLLTLRPDLMTALGIGGGVMLLGMGMRALLAPSGPVVVRVRSSRLLLGGFAVSLANPLTLVFFMAVFPQFVTLEALANAPLMTALCIAAVVLSTALATLPYMLVAACLSRTSFAGVLGRASGVVLVALGAGFIGEGML